LFALGSFAIITVTSPAFAMCAFDQENPFAPCQDEIGTLEYPKSPDELIPAPLKQMKLGIKLGHIICDQDKYPVWNVHYKPACVFDESHGELLTRGWAKLRLLLPAGPDPITELEVMGQNLYSLQILGNYRIGDEKYPLSEPRKKELAWEYSQQYHSGESYLEYAITPYQNYYNTGDLVQFDLLEWGNYSDCWDLKVRILDVKNNPVYEDNSIRYCLEPDGLPGRFHSFSIGDDFAEFVCDRPGYYRIEVSNGEIFPADILENFVCIDKKPEPIPEPTITNEPEEGYERLKYRTTSPVIQDTYLSKTVQQWQDTPRSQLESEHDEYGDEFYIELGRLLVKNEMVNQIQKNNITLENYEFEVYSGMMLTSLPPHISYQAVVNDTSNRVFLLEGSSHANQINFYKTSELKFPELSDQLPADYILTKPQSITILPEEGNNARAEPHNAIIHRNDNSVEFINTTPFTIRIQDSGSGRVSDEHELAWIGPEIKPNQSAVVTFDFPGYYEWDARTAPTIEQPDWWGSHAGGSIVLLSDEVNNLPFEDRVKMAGTIVMESDIPLVGLGMGNNEGLRVDFNQAITKALPGASQYYKQKILQLIPFDVPVIIQE
jgi:hypothetical protein